jgi:putative ABC transport system permease protein
MIKHILKQIWAQRVANSLLWVELFLVSIFLWFIVDYVYVATDIYYTPTGFNLEHTYQVSMDQLLPESSDYVAPDNKKTTLGEDYLTVINRIRTYPGVEAVALSKVGIPYATGNMFNTFAHDTANVSMQCRNVTPDYFRVFKVTTPDGKTEPLVSGLKNEQSCVISKDSEERLMSGKGSANGIMLTAGDSSKIKVVGVSSYIRYSEFKKKGPCIFIKLSEVDIAKINTPDNFNSIEITFRVSPGADHDFINRFRKDMNRQLKVNNLFMIDIKPMSKVRDIFFLATGDFNELKTRLAVVVFLLINIFLGIIGTFWFRTAYRKGEMGLRLAIGSTRTNLRGLLVAEALLLLTLAAIPAAVICFNIGHAELVDINRMDFTYMRFFMAMAATYLLMAVMIVSGIWYPARQAMKIQPAEVLHEQ